MSKRFRRFFVIGFLSSFSISSFLFILKSMLRLRNTLSGKIEEFKSIEKSLVKMYNCGPTVYGRIHLGNLRAFFLADILKRVLKYNGYEIKQVMNITDVGHLTEEGLDKIEEEAKKEKKTAQEITAFYTQKFFEDLDKLNIDTSDIIFPRASAHINEQLALIEKLERRGFTYKTSDGIYFDTREFLNYGKLGSIDLEKLKEGARVLKNPEKKNPADFALWKFSKEGEKRQQEWPSPYGLGFPGWHIECSAMSMKYLGEHFDIHTGGVDNIFPHHNNEIAQSESATGKPFVNFWLHNAHLKMKGEKASKSLGNILTLEELAEKGISPLSYRYWLLTSVYSTPVHFSLQAVKGAETALNKLRDILEELPDDGEIDKDYRALFKGFINDDLNTPKALALVWGLVKDREISSGNKKATILDFDKVLGFRLNEFQKLEIPKKIQRLAGKREQARLEKNWAESDKLRNEILKQGFGLKDTSDGTDIYKISGQKNFK